MTLLKNAQQEPTRRCPFCHDEVGAGGDEIKICQKCFTWHHMSCYQEHHGCSSLACHTYSQPHETEVERDSQSASLRSRLSAMTRSLLTWVRNLWSSKQKKPQDISKPHVVEEKDWLNKPVPSRRQRLLMALSNLLKNILWLNPEFTETRKMLRKKHHARLLFACATIGQIVLTLSIVYQGVNSDLFYLGLLGWFLTTGLAWRWHPDFPTP